MPAAFRSTMGLLVPAAVLVLFLVAIGLSVVGLLPNVVGFGSGTDHS